MASPNVGELNVLQVAPGFPSKSLDALTHLQRDSEPATAGTPAVPAKMTNENAPVRIRQPNEGATKELHLCQNTPGLRNAQGLS